MPYTTSRLALIATLLLLAAWPGKADAARRPTLAWGVVGEDRVALALHLSDDATAETGRLLSRARTEGWTRHHELGYFDVPTALIPEALEKATTGLWNVACLGGSAQVEATGVGVDKDDLGPRLYIVTPIPGGARRGAHCLGVAPRASASVPVMRRAVERKVEIVPPVQLVLEPPAAEVAALVPEVGPKSSAAQPVGEPEPPAEPPIDRWARLHKQLLRFSAKPMKRLLKDRELGPANAKLFDGRFGGQRATLAVLDIRHVFYDQQTELSGMVVLTEEGRYAGKIRPVEPSILRYEVAYMVDMGRGREAAIFVERDDERERTVLLRWRMGLPDEVALTERSLTSSSAADAL